MQKHIIFGGVFKQLYHMLVF